MLNQGTRVAMLRGNFGVDKSNKRGMGKKRKVEKENKKRGRKIGKGKI